MAPDSFFAPEVDISEIQTEDDTPVDNFFSEKQQRLLTEPLFCSWSGPGEGRKFVAAANVGVFFSPRKPPIVPDALLSLDVEVDPDIWAKEHRSYFVWEFGKVPDIVIEVVSNKEGGEADKKFAIYRAMRIPFYLIFDPQRLLSEEELRIFELRNLFYRQTEDLWLDGAQLGVTLWKGTFEGMEAIWLRWCDRAGNLIPAGFEERQRAEVERQRADAERQRAEAECQRAGTEHERAEKERLRAEKLTARLIALGMDPGDV